MMVFCIRNQIKKEEKEYKKLLLNISEIDITDKTKHAEIATKMQKLFDMISKAT